MSAIVWAMRERSRRSGAARQTLGHAQAPLGQRKQHHAGVRGHPPAVECGYDFLPLEGWKREKAESYRRSWQPWWAQWCAKDLSTQPNPTRFQLLKPWLPALKSVRHA
jgi:hypothetical protein